MSTSAPPQAVSFGRRLTDLAEEASERTALVFAAADGQETEFTRRDLDQRSNRLARVFAERGVEQGSTVVIGLPNSPEHVLSAYAAWKLGAMVVPLPAAMPPQERDAVLELADPNLVVSVWGEIDWPGILREDLTAAEDYSDKALPNRVANPGRAMASGGSTGRPKLIIRKGPWAFPPGIFIKVFEPLGFLEDRSDITLIPGPLYHEAPFLGVHTAIFEGISVVLMERFDAEQVLDLVERRRPTALGIVPIMMQRMLEVNGVEERDWSSVRSVSHVGAPCAPWLKQAWIDLLGPERINELYGGTEGNGYAMVNGVEWLRRPGTVGKPYLAEMKVLDNDGNEVPRGDVGRIFSRSSVAQEIPFEYAGAEQAPQTDEGFSWIGDLGWMDEDGYVYLADRRTDLIISGGANVFAAQVEAALSEHPAVADVAVIGLPDDTWGKRVHAIIQPHDIGDPPPEAELDSWCRQRLSAYKRPKTYEFIKALPRTEAGKIRRSAMVEERSN